MGVEEAAYSSRDIALSCLLTWANTTALDTD